MNMNNIPELTLQNTQKPVAKSKLVSMSHGNVVMHDAGCIIFVNFQIAPSRKFYYFYHKFIWNENALETTLARSYHHAVHNISRVGTTCSSHRAYSNEYSKMRCLQTGIVELFKTGAGHYFGQRECL